MWAHVADNRFHLASAELSGRVGHRRLRADAPPDSVSGERAVGRQRARERQEMNAGRLDIPRSRPGPGVGDACLRGSTCKRSASSGVSRTLLRIWGRGTRNASVPNTAALECHAAARELGVAEDSRAVVAVRPDHHELVVVWTEALRVSRQTGSGPSRSLRI